MTAPPDVLVIGGGPAGAALAALAASAGARVLLVERERFPRHKLCGEFLSAEGSRVLERLGARGPLEARGARPITACRITDRRGRSVEAPLPAPGGGSALGVSRSLLDATLLDLARRRGAEVRERTEAVAPLIEAGGVRGAFVRAVGSGEPGCAMRATVVVAADGRRSILGRALHPALGDPARSGPRAWLGLERHVAADPARLGGRVELHLFDGGYAGLAAVEGDVVNLCLLARVGVLRACGGSPDRLLRDRVFENPAARALLSGALPRGPWRSIAPLRFGPRRPSAAGALFLGDAAGTIDPFSGNGMTHALRSAEIALPFVLEAAARGGLAPDLAQAYERAWRSAFEGVTRRARRIGWLLGRPVLAAAAVALLARTGRSLFPRLVASTRAS